MHNAKHYTSRPCTMFGESLTWCVTGGHADGSGGGVLAWCWDAQDAQEALAALEATGEYVDLAYGQY